MRSYSSATAATAASQQPLGHMLADPNLQTPARPSVVDCSAVTSKLVHDGRRTGVGESVLRRASGNVGSAEKDVRLRGGKGFSKKTRNRATQACRRRTELEGKSAFQLTQPLKRPVEKLLAIL